MPRTAGQLRDRYCNGNYTECVRFMLAQRYGMDKVPTYIYPNDIFCDLNSRPPESCGSQGGMLMYLKVIYPDGTVGKVRSASIGHLAKTGEIVAYQCSEGWVELRRKRYAAYRGPDRRQASPY